MIGTKAIRTLGCGMVFILSAPEIGPPFSKEYGHDEALVSHSNPHPEEQRHRYPTELSRGSVSGYATTNSVFLTRFYLDEKKPENSMKGYV